jgi:hypothetical protein
VLSLLKESSHPEGYADVSALLERGHGSLHIIDLIFSLERLDEDGCGVHSTETRQTVYHNLG